MKQSKTWMLIPALAVLLLSAGCSGSGSGTNGQSEGSDAQTASNSAVQATDLVFSDDFHADDPQITAYETFTLTPKPAKNLQTLYNLFDSAVEQYFPNVFSAEEKKNLYRVSGEDENGENLSGLYDEMKGQFPDDNSRVPWLLFNCEKAMMQMMPNGALQTVTGDKAYQLENGQSGNIGMYCAAEHNTIRERIAVPADGKLPDQTVHLLDGDISLKDACAQMLQFLQNDFDPETGCPDLKPEIAEVWIVDFKDDISGLYFLLTSSYQGIRLDTAYSQNGIGFSYIYDNGENLPFELQSGYAFMIEKGKFDSVMVYGTEHAQDLSNKQEQTLKISYADAQDQLRKEVSNLPNMLFQRAQLVYLPYGKQDEKVKQVKAFWKFTAKNETDRYTYVFYVDAETGAVDYYKY